MFDWETENEPRIEIGWKWLTYSERGESFKIYIDPPTGYGKPFTFYLPGQERWQEVFPEWAAAPARGNRRAHQGRVRAFPRGMGGRDFSPEKFFFFGAPEVVPTNDNRAVSPVACGYANPAMPNPQPRYAPKMPTRSRLCEFCIRTGSARPAAGFFQFSFHFWTILFVRSANGTGSGPYTQRFVLTP